jgi:phosphoribosyl 1,2-cyclic phosphodiesterase
VRARIWGCRGSLATPGPSTVRYGGNTSCLELRPSGGGLVVLDAGTGIRPLGVAIGRDRPSTINLLLTHLHLDHVEGLGFFLPLWDPEVDLHIWGPPAQGRSLHDRIAAYLSPPLFPKPFAEIPARLHFHEVPSGEWELAGLRIVTRPVTHPGPTVAYRLEENGEALAFIPDNEPALAGDLRSQPADSVSGLALASGADVVFHDSQYTEDEYRTRVGWGHSSVADAMTFCQLAQPGRFVMFHHEPAHSDADLELMLERAHELAGDAAELVVLAHEGMEIDLSS